jgi:hypothetical protein
MMTLDEWDKAIGHHLHMIEAGGEMAARHADQLLARPDWKTLTEIRLEQTEMVLSNALRAVRAARQAIAEKEIDA